MSNTATMPVDGNKLYSELRKRGITASEASREIGYSSNNIRLVKHRGKATKSMLILLRQVYGIEYDKIKPDDEETETTEEPRKGLAEEVKQEIYQIVCVAVAACLTAHKDEFYKIAYAAAWAAIEASLNS